MRKLLDRIRSEGLWSTLAYLIITLGIEKLRLQINYLFTYPLERQTTIDVGPMVVIQHAENFDHKLQEQISQLSDWHYVNELISQLDKGRVIVMSLINDKPASIGLLARRKTDKEYIKTGDWVFKNAYTFPYARGKGMHLKTLVARCQYALHQMEKEASTNQIVTEVSIANTASTRGITKAGFVKQHLIIKYKGKLVKMFNLAK